MDTCPETKSSVRFCNLQLNIPALTWFLGGLIEFNLYNWEGNTLQATLLTVDQQLGFSLEGGEKVGRMVPSLSPDRQISQIMIAVRGAGGFNATGVASLYLLYLTIDLDLGYFGENCMLITYTRL